MEGASELDEVGIIADGNIYIVGDVWAAVHTAYKDVGDELSCGLRGVFFARKEGLVGSICLCDNASGF